MTKIETIRAKMLEAASTTLGDKECGGSPEDDFALAALLESRIVAHMLDEGYFTRQSLPLPPISRQFEMQLEVLWREYQRAAGADCQAIRGAFDRIVAELYGLTVDDLVTLERQLP